MQPALDDDAITAIARGLIHRTLPKADWTHAAHFAAALWLLRRNGPLQMARRMPSLIRIYNLSTGVVNTDSAGYHETITQASLAAAFAWLDQHGPEECLSVVLAGLLASPLGQPDWLLAYWSKDRLMSPQARRAWLAPNLAPFPYLLLDD